MFPIQASSWLHYFQARIHEQTLDNILDPLCIATTLAPNHKGVDYHVHRKAVGLWLNGQCSLVDGVWRLTDPAEYIVKLLMDEGVHFKTIQRWIYKYGGEYRHKSFVFKRQS